MCDEAELACALVMAGPPITTSSVWVLGRCSNSWCVPQHMASGRGCLSRCALQVQTCLCLGSAASVLVCLARIEGVWWQNKNFPRSASQVPAAGLWHGVAAHATVLQEVVKSCAHCCLLHMAPRDLCIACWCKVGQPEGCACHCRVWVTGFASRDTADAVCACWAL